MASSALNALIAAQRGPDIAGSIMGGIQAAKQEQAQQQMADLREQQISMGQRQLAGLDAKEAQAKKAESLKFAADIGTQIAREKDPARRAAIYEQGRQAATLMGADTSWWPRQYDDKTQIGLDNAVNHIYGEERFKTDEKIRENQAKGAQPASNVGKLLADRAAAAAAGASAADLAAYDAAIEKAGRSSGPMVSVTVGDKQPLTKSNTSKVQDKVMDAESALSDLSSIANKYSGDFLTYAGRAKALAGSVADKVGVENATAKELVDFNAKRTGFRNSINQFFNQYRKEITGAAASEKEMQFLMESMFNQNLGPQEFKAAFNQFVDKAKKNYELNKRALREGVSVVPRENERGWTLQIDADGNQAYVNPENPEEYEEVD